MSFLPQRILRIGGQPMTNSAKPAAKASRPVTLKHLAATLAGEHQLTKRIRIAGLGILQVRKRAARMGRNPATGEAIKIKASKKVAFRAAKELKLAV
jgi:DNA-binding protein HU-beta